VTETVDEQPRDVERLTYFSDAVIAIAVTLLVLPLANAASADEITSLQALRDQSGGEIFVFLLSFVVICRFWLVHHRRRLPPRLRARPGRARRGAVRPAPADPLEPDRLPQVPPQRTGVNRVRARGRAGSWWGRPG
jgi:hypothetical protein